MSIVHDALTRAKKGSYFFFFFCRLRHESLIVSWLLKFRHWLKKQHYIVFGPSFLIEIKIQLRLFILTRLWSLPGTHRVSGRQSQLRLISFCSQLQNQEQLRAMMKKAELEISGRVIEMMKRLEDPVQRQRVLVEQERQKYLQEEEKIVKKLW